MKGKEIVKKAPSTDLLACFPSRAHLALMPKPVCSPARAIEAGKRHRRLRKSSTIAGGSFGGGPLQASPLLWAKNKQMTAGGPENAEPTSPKVTCAGQIKVRHKGACKSWKSVMEEIERIHRENKKRSSSSWVNSFGLKKEVMQFLTCLRNIRFDFRCFGAEEELDEKEPQNDGVAAGNEDVFSKWFMVLQENGNDVVDVKDTSFSDDAPLQASVPPLNALLLMRCRSAPAKSWLEEEEKIEEKKRALMEEERKNSNKEDLERIVIMKYETDFYKISSEIAKETWVNGGMKDLSSRSRSCKR